MKGTSFMLKLAAKEALILLCISVGLAAAVYLARPDKIELESLPETPDESLPVASDGPVAEISLENALQHFKDGSALFADARHQADFEIGHIEGAVNLYLDDQETWLSDFLNSTDPATAIIAYCDGEACHLAPDLAEFLFFNGFDHVFYLKNGWSLWKEGGLPTAP